MRQTLSDEVLAVRREVRWYGGPISIHDLVEELPQVLDLGPRLACGCKFDESAAERPDVASPADFHLFQCFGRHPENTPLNLIEELSRLLSETLTKLLVVDLEHS